eukprot:TRINITY_DN5042_c0_g1_i1.p3 TRINITY_DN5042_c0_g1~~TRINITY_DN5042_c0_g1_i1.p3  ORF type:complete len:121 (-),score=21.38 TRINITY_DN5042_c0_g1_i1:280-642(-)
MAGVLRSVRGQVSRHLKIVDNPATFSGQKRFVSDGKVNGWEKPLSPGDWKEEHLVIVSLTAFYFLVRYLSGWVSNQMSTKAALKEAEVLEKQEHDEAALEQKYGHGIPVSPYYVPSAPSS